MCNFYSFFNTSSCHWANESSIFSNSFETLFSPIDLNVFTAQFSTNSLDDFLGSDKNNIRVQQTWLLLNCCYGQLKHSMLLHRYTFRIWTNDLSYNAQIIFFFSIAIAFKEAVLRDRFSPSDDVSQKYDI